jgi:hypothetical protein
MVTAVIVALWVVVMALVWWWWAGADDQADAPGGAEVDPYSAEVAAFRRQVHDWDRGGRG